MIYLIKSVLNSFLIYNGEIIYIIRDIFVNKRYVNVNSFSSYPNYIILKSYFI